MSIDTVALIVGGAPEKAEVQGEGAGYQIVGNSNDDNLEDDLEEFELLPLPISQRPHPLWQWLKLTIIVLILLALAVVMFHWGVPFLLDKVIIPLLVWESKEFTRPVLAVVLVFSMAIFPIFLFPSGPSMWLTGMVFGYGLGFLIIMVGTTIGQTFPYWIGRWALHNRIQTWLQKYPKKAAVLQIAEQGGWVHQARTIALLRVSPFPYPLFNYAVTATKIKYAPYIAGSILGMIPEAFITIYSGKLLSTLAEAQNHKRAFTPVEIAYNAVGACVALTIAITGTLYGHRSLQELELKEAAEREAKSQLSQSMVDVVSDS